MGVPPDPDNPFTPGTATMPLHIAGREDEQGMISKALRLVKKTRKDGILERSPMPPIKIIGPRGAGKSTLLSWTEREAVKQDIHVVRCAHLKEGKPEKDLASLINRMLGPYRKDKQVSVSLGVPNLVSYKTSGQVEAIKTYHNVLKALLERTPIALLLDEAMHYDSDPFATVLQENQELISQSRPLVMIIAGTPALDSHLEKVDATFIDRAEELSINRIRDEAVREALREPFNKCGVQVANDALDLMASWTENYPYFIQLAGEAVWNVMKADKCSEVDLDLVQKAKDVMQERHKKFYKRVYERIRRADLLPYARLVVDLVEETTEPMAPEQLVEKLEERSEHGKDKINFSEILDLLQDYGLVWITDDRRVQAAIPSFFTYLKSEYKPQKS